MTTVVSVTEAKRHLSRLIEQVLAGEEVVITRNKEPVVRLIREGAAKKKLVCVEPVFDAFDVKRT